MNAPRAYDSAYPGSMCERDDGYYLRRDDHASLAAALIELIASRDREIEDLREVVATPQEPAVNADLLAALNNIRQMTDADDPESYRCDDPEGCLDTVFEEAVSAIAKASGGAV